MTSENDVEVAEQIASLIESVIESLGEDISEEVLQNLLENQDLVKKMLLSNLSEVDRRLFNGIFDPDVSKRFTLTLSRTKHSDFYRNIRFTPVHEYVERIMARSELRGWGFTGKHADELRKQLTGLDHSNALSPIGVQIWRGNDLEYNWTEAVAWLIDEAKSFACENVVQPWLLRKPCFLPGSEITGDQALIAVQIDLHLWSYLDGMLWNIEKDCQSRWPSIEIPDTLALNPHIIQLMDGYNYPMWMVPGIHFQGGDTAHFGYFKNTKTLYIGTEHTSPWGDWVYESAICRVKQVN